MKVFKYKKVKSTQDVAKELLKRGIGNFIVVADFQTEGRGRIGRKWLSPPGGIYFSFVSDIDSRNFMKAGVAVANMLRKYGIKAWLKWPNDVLVNGRKIAGILIENFEGKAIVGIGINDKISPMTQATCLAEHGIKVERLSLVKEIVNEFYRASPDEYQRFCITIGKKVGVETLNRMITGMAKGIDKNGALIVYVNGRMEKIFAGDCIHLKE